MAFPVSNWSEMTAVFGFSRTVGYSPEHCPCFWFFSAAAVHIQRGITTFCIPNSSSLPIFVFPNVPHRPLGKSGVTCQ